MSKSDKKVDTPSTVEAIRMASASVLGTTTNLGYPLGSAIGSGSMMEENSEAISMNITPLVFAIRDALQTSEGLEILSMEWDLERIPGPGVLPEQLIVAGGSSEGIGAHVCVLCWEKGVVDPFKIDAHMQSISKKLADIETAVMNNGLAYESEGLPILRSFNDRFNRVTFIDMLDRRFQGSWDSYQIKSEHVDNELLVSMAFRSDFTMLPPGQKITERTLLEFMLPSQNEEALMNHFKHRILTPSGIEALAVKIPEAGRAILNEMNTYAFSIEEVEIANSTTALLKDYLGRQEISHDEIVSLKGQLDEFSSFLSEAVDALEKLMDEHVGSGKTLSLPDHNAELVSQIDLHNDWFVGFRRNVALHLIEQFMKSIRREFFDVAELRAWRLRSISAYFLIYAKRVARYFTRELGQYLLASSARKAFLSALNEFQDEIKSETSSAMDKMLFNKFYAELFAQMNASFDKNSYEGIAHSSVAELVKDINQEMQDAFTRIDIWDLIDFTDIAEITRAEVNAKYSSANSEGGQLTDTGQALIELLSSFEDLVIDIIPNIADTLLSKTLVRRLIDRMIEED
ncbi:MAG: hypothetical protein ACFE7R_11105, partial [Candidatus Hodarchaeota archaeon]